MVSKTQLYVVQINYRGDLVCRVIVLACSIKNAKTKALADPMVQSKCTSVTESNTWVFVDITKFTFTIDAWNQDTFVF